MPRFWILSGVEVVVLPQFSGNVLNKSNNTLLYRVAPDGTDTLQLRANEASLKSEPLSRVEVHPQTRRPRGAHLPLRH